MEYDNALSFLFFCVLGTLIVILLTGQQLNSQGPTLLSWVLGFVLGSMMYYGFSAWYNSFRDKNARRQGYSSYEAKVKSEQEKEKNKWKKLGFKSYSEYNQSKSSDIFLTILEWIFILFFLFLFTSFIYGIFMNGYVALLVFFGCIALIIILERKAKNIRK